MSSRKYTNAKVYKIVSDSDDGIYIGSTTTTLPRRLWRHKEEAESNPNRRVYKHIQENGGWDAWQIVLVATYPECQSEAEIKQKEEQHRVQYNSQPRLLNSRVAWTGLTARERQREINAENPGPNRRRANEWYHSNQQRVQEYRVQNRERMREYKRNKTEYCEVCQMDIKSNHRSRHQSSKTHICNFIRY